MSNAYNILIGNALDPRESVFSVYASISHTLNNTNMSESAKARYLAAHPNRHNRWSSNSLVFDNTEATEMRAKDGMITIEFGQNKPCGRGCCSDWISDEMTIPDHLITLYEATQEGVYAEEYFEDHEAHAAFGAAITAHVQTLIDEIEGRISAEEAEKQRKAEQAKVAAQRRREREAEEKEAHDRAEYERLKEKFS